MKTVEFYKDIESTATGESYVKEDGCRIWVIPEKQWHREDGPAFINAHGTQEWWINNTRHRLDGPARISSYGCWWYKQHRLDRLNGPAHCYVDAITGEYNEYYWLNNTEISETEYWNNPEVIKHKLKKIIEL